MYVESSVPAEEEFVLMPAVGKTLVVGIKEEWLKERKGVDEVIGLCSICSDLVEILPSFI